jgi:branched-chain amino acid transport system ATP-binding protein
VTYDQIATQPVGTLGPAHLNGHPAGPILEVSGVAVQFGGVRALDAVSLSLDPGHCCGVIGPNGAGKTTLFDVISGFTPANAGSVLFDGKDITSWSVLARARAGLARTYQRQQVFGGLSVEENVLVPLEWQGGGGGVWGDLVHARGRMRRERERRAHAAEIVDLCGLADVRHLPADTLSIGRARMAELARAIVGSPKVLLLDEPTSGLEAGEIERMGAVIEWVRRELGTAVLLIEHDVAFVMTTCSRITVLVVGAVLAEGAPEEIQSHEEVRRAYLG